MTTRRNMIKAGAGLAAILASGKAPAYLIHSMLAARQGLGVSAGKRLPYDARVQYIESNGTQYIDTGVVPKSTIGAKMLLLVKGSQSDRVILMAGGDSVGWRWGFSSTGSSIQVSGVNAAGATFNNYGCAYDTIHEVIYNWGADLSAVVDGDTVRTGIPSGSTDRTETIWINASANGNPSSPWRYNSMKVYSLKLCDGLNIIRDFIPVRVGTKGYLYDSITGLLFGDGDFAAGPDVFEVQPTSDGYVQNGLVLMFDAIENAGRGLHSSDSQEWIDVGGKAGFSPHWGTCIFSEKIATLNACVLRGVNGYFTSGLNAAKFTVQYIIPSSTDQRGYVFWRYGSSSTNPSIEIQRNYDLTMYSDTGQSFLNSGLDSSHIFRTITIDGNEWTMYDRTNSVAKTVSYTQKTFISSNQLALLGSAQGSSAYHYTGTACAIRIYSRALTAAEIASNYAVDAQRFNLP